VRPKVHYHCSGDNHRPLHISQIGEYLRIPRQDLSTERKHQKAAYQAIPHVEDRMTRRSQRLQLRTDGTNKRNSQHPCCIHGGKGDIKVVINKKDNIALVCHCDFLQSAIVGWKTRTYSEMLEIAPHREVKSTKPIHGEREHVRPCLLILKGGNPNSMSSSCQCL